MKVWQHHDTLYCFLCVQSLDLQMKMVSDKMQDGKQKAKPADSDESFQGNWLNSEI